MPRNIEIKARISDLAALRARAASVATAAPIIIDQVDAFFDAPLARLKVRAFSDGSGELIAYRRADRHGPKESVYSRTACGDAAGLAAALAAALPLRGRVVKRRELFMAGRTRIHLDDVEGLGTFLELEVVLRDGEAAADGEREACELMRALGVDARDLVPDAYIDLLARKAGV